MPQPSSATRTAANLADRQPAAPLRPAVVAEELLVPLAQIDLTDQAFATRSELWFKPLQAQLAQDGQLNAVHLLPRADGKYQVLAGFRRCSAATALGWTQVRAVVHPGLSDAEAWRLAWQDNAARKTMTQADRQWTVARLAHAGHTQATIAAMLGVAKATVQRDAVFVGLPESVRRQVGEAGFTVRHALLLAAPLAAQPGRNLGPLLADVRAREPDAREFAAMVRQFFATARRGRTGVQSNGSRLTIDEARLDPAALTDDEAARLLERLAGIQARLTERLGGRQLGRPAASTQ